VPKYRRSKPVRKVGAPFLWSCARSEEGRHETRIVHHENTPTRVALNQFRFQNKLSHVSLVGYFEIRYRSALNAITTQRTLRISCKGSGIGSSVLMDVNGLGYRARNNTNAASIIPRVFPALTPLFPPSAVRRLPKGQPNPLRSNGWALANTLWHGQSMPRSPAVSKFKVAHYPRVARSARNGEPKYNGISGAEEASSQQAWQLTMMTKA
jgi:hypothetical protein